MIESFVCLPCPSPKCGLTETLPRPSLDAITDNETGFVNWVCKDCGLGSIHFIGQLEERPRDPLVTLFPRPLYRAYLRCETASLCERHVTVYTIAKSEDQKAGPVKPIGDWRVGALKCRNEHHPKLNPIDVVEDDVVAPGGCP
jgi:hypothetical protein